MSLSLLLLILDINMFSMLLAILQELQEFLKDLNQWETRVKEKDKELKTKPREGASVRITHLCNSLHIQ
jgi:hypothetical protein